MNERKEEDARVRQVGTGPYIEEGDGNLEEEDLILCRTLTAA